MTVNAIIDHAQVRRNRQRAARLNADGADFLLRYAIDDCLERLAAVNRKFESALVVGPQAGSVGGALVGAGKVETFEACGADGLGPDEIVPSGPQAHDLAVCLLALHETNDLPGVLVQLRHALKPDGLLMACLPGGETLKELRDAMMQAELAVRGGAHARVMPFVDVRDAGALLQRAGFALPVTDTEKIVARYDTLFDLARELRAMGATNTLNDRAKNFTPASILHEAARHYGDHHADTDGRICATFEFVWMCGWKPDESQPKALKPGSGRMSLTRVLGDRSEVPD